MSGDEQGKIDLGNFQLPKLPEPTPEELKASEAYFERTHRQGATFRIEAEKVGDNQYVATSVKRVKTPVVTDN